MGLLLFWLIPGIKRAPLTDMRGILTSGGIGFLAMIVPPIAVVILIVTLIGIPVALTTLLLWLLTLCFAQIVVARSLGGILLKNGRDSMGHTAVSLLLGLIFIVIVTNIPYIGGILSLLLTIIGMGALLIAAYRMFKDKNPAEMPQDSAA